MTANIQIFGTLKCQDTNKALRFFKERNIKVHFVDLKEKAITAGELDNISRTVPIDDLIDKEGKEFKKLNLGYIIHDVKEKLLEYPLLFKTPVTRFGKLSTAGYQPEIWKKWLK
jgi:arsenate reductase (glutaredoxin)